MSLGHNLINKTIRLPPWTSVHVHMCACVCMCPAWVHCVCASVHHMCICTWGLCMCVLCVPVRACALPECTDRKERRSLSPTCHIVNPCSLSINTFLQWQMQSLIIQEHSYPGIHQCESLCRKKWQNLAQVKQDPGIFPTPSIIVFHFYIKANRPVPEVHSRG